MDDYCKIFGELAEDGEATIEMKGDSFGQLIIIAEMMGCIAKVNGKSFNDILDLLPTAKKVGEWASEEEGEDG